VHLLLRVRTWVLEAANGRGWSGVGTLGSGGRRALRRDPQNLPLSQSAAVLNKARGLLDQAETMMRVNLFEAAGRTAYLAALHAAHAFIFETTGKVIKRHKGVHSKFTICPVFPCPNFAALTAAPERAANDTRNARQRLPAAYWRGA
jgi:uracil-DNA glycosylase